MFIDYLEGFFPVIGFATVDIKVNVRERVGCLKVVTIDVTGCDQLNEGPTRSTHVTRRINLQFTQRHHLKLRHQIIHEVRSDLHHSCVVEFVAEVRIEEK